MTSVTCTVFDIDDTLYLERDYVRSGFAAVESNSGIRGLATTSWRIFLGGVRSRIFDEALRELGSLPEPGLVEELVRLYRAHEPDIELLPDAVAALSAAAEFGPVYCITDGPFRSQRAKAAALRISNWAEKIIFTEALGRGFAKPHTRAFDMVAGESRLPAEAHAYVADNPTKDFEAPRLLGWSSVRVRRTGSLHEGLPTPPGVQLEVADLCSFPHRAMNSTHDGWRRDGVGERCSTAPGVADTAAKVSGAHRNDTGD